MANLEDENGRWLRPPTQDVPPENLYTTARIERRIAARVKQWANYYGISLTDAYTQLCQAGFHEFAFGMRKGGPKIPIDDEDDTQSKTVQPLNQLTAAVELLTETVKSMQSTN